MEPEQPQIGKKRKAPKVELPQNVNEDIKKLENACKMKDKAEIRNYVKILGYKMLTKQEVKDAKTYILRKVRKVLKESSGKEVEQATEQKILHAGRIKEMEVAV